MANFELQFVEDYCLTTAQIYYHLPDHPSFIQEFIWQDYDRIPTFPKLKNFLGFWVSEIEGKLHSVYVAQHKIITASDAKFLEFDIEV